MISIFGLFSKTNSCNWAIDFISKEFDFPRLINISDLKFLHARLMAKAENEALLLFEDKVIVAVSTSASYLFRKVRRYPVIQFKYN